MTKVVGGMQLATHVLPSMVHLQSGNLYNFL